MVAAIIFGRLSSQRLPCKLLKKVGSKQLIFHVYERAKLLNVDKIIVATSRDSSDDKLVDLLIENEIDYFRGDLKNVALRACECIEEFKLTSFVRINGDSPLVPVNELNIALDQFRNSSLDFVTNLYPRSYPYGYSIEIFAAKIFLENYKHFNLNEQEHISKYFYDNSGKFNYKNYLLNNLFFSNSMSLTIDDHATYDFMNSFFTSFPNLENASLKEIIELYNKKMQING